jgi:two-component system LytT family response regulator/two-component system response regulator LytT
MKLKALIVDDEYPARQELRFMLENYADTIQIVGEAANAHEAWELITALEYSVLFLDIHMPGLNGLELASRLQEHTREAGNNAPFIVFVTAYEEFALDAFGVNAVDYLLKPIDTVRFDRTLQKIFAMLKKEKQLKSRHLHRYKKPRLHLWD